MQALDSRWHPSRRDPVDLGDVAEHGPIAEVRLVRPLIRGGELVIVREFITQGFHDVACLESRHRGGRSRVTQVVEGGKRGAVIQPRRGGGHRGIAADAPCRDSHHATCGTTELGLQHGQIGVADGRKRRSTHIIRVPSAAGRLPECLADQPGSGTPIVIGATVWATPEVVIERTSCDIQSVRVCSTSPLTGACSCGSRAAGRSLSTR